MYKPSFQIGAKLQIQNSWKLQQMLKVLMMNRLDLESWVLEEVEKNPLLEIDFPQIPKAPPETLYEAAYQVTLYEHLKAQAQNRFFDTLSLQIALSIIGNLNNQGFLDHPKEALAEEHGVSIRQVEKILSTLKTFDPLGICAENLQECLLVQLQEKKIKPSPIVIQIVENYFSELCQANFSFLEKIFSMKRKKLIPLLQREMKFLNFCPASSFSREKNYSLIPDLLLVKDTKKKFKAICNESFSPKAYWKKEYQPLESLLPKEEKKIISAFKTKGLFFFYCLEKRKKTLESIASYIVNKQKGFLERRSELVPLTLKEVAEGVGLHISTVARALQGKAIDTPLGVLPMKSLLPQHLPQNEERTKEEAKKRIEGLIQQENKKKPLSDKDLSLQLQKEGIYLSRRTVSKYRKELSIEGQAKRKSL